MVAVAYFVARVRSRSTHPTRSRCAAGLPRDAQAAPARHAGAADGGWLAAVAGVWCPVVAGHIWRRTVPSSLFVIHVGRVLLLLVCLFVLLQQQLLVALTAVMEMGMHESMQLLMGELRHQLSPAEQSTALGLSLSEYYRRRRDAVAVLLDMLLRHGEVPDC